MFLKYSEYEILYFTFFPKKEAHKCLIFYGETKITICMLAFYFIPDTSLFPIKISETFHTFPSQSLPYPFPYTWPKTP